jgi:hypothetical protein
VSYKRWSVLGWTLFGISWVTPNLDGDGIGARAFWAAVRHGLRYLIQPDSVSGLALGLCLLLGWSANFSVFIPFPVAVRKGWIAAPWLPFAAILLLNVPFAIRERLLTQLYFYPWAIGIGLIHAAKIADTRGR